MAIGMSNYTEHIKATKNSTLHGQREMANTLTTYALVFAMKADIDRSSLSKSILRT
jgi:hypothetical protein